MPQVRSISSKSKMNKVLKEAGDDTLVVAEFYANWCPNCPKIAPAFDEFAEKYDDATFVKVNVDEAPDIHTDYDVTATPSFVFIKDGEVIDTFAGSNPGMLEQVIQKYV